MPIDRGNSASKVLEALTGVNAQEKRQAEIPEKERKERKDIVQVR